jgi:ankyrin repeat protein/virulence-associated protein VapD
MKVIILLSVILLFMVILIGCEKELSKSSEPVKKTTPLHQAAADGDIEQVRLLISKGADVDAKDEKGNTPLCHAVESGKIEIVQMLVDAGADVNTGKWPPLCEAVDQNNVAIAKYLITHGANVDAPEGWTALQEAPYIKDNIEMVKLLIANGADVNAGPYTALHVSVDQGRKDIAELLIKYGADINIGDEDGDTPLHIAGLYHPDMIEFLLANGADINAKDKRGRTLLHLILDSSIRKKHKKVKDVVELLIANGADVNSKDKEGRTALHLAAESADADIVELLLDKGAGIDEKDDEYGFTALHSAARFGNKDIAELLINKGANINARDKQGHTPLYIAVHHDHKVAELLVDKGADGTIKVESGQTLLQLAQERKQIESTTPDMIFDSDPNSRFGFPIVCGDVDGDGYDDIVIGAGAYNNKQGRAYLFYGGPNMDTNCDLIFEGENEEDMFGVGMGCDDIDNDGYEDIVIAACGYKKNQGRVYLYWSSDRSSMDAIPDKIFEEEPKEGAWFGLSHPGPFIYDIDKDGYRDIIIGSHWHLNDETGRAYLYYGNTKELMDTTYDLVFTGENANDQFGESISCGDIDKDGYGDIVIGARNYPGGKPSQGRAYLYYGDSRSNMNAKADVIFDSESAEKNYFGQGIALSDFNKDGYDDIVIGAQGYNKRQGRVYLYYGSTRAELDIIPEKTFDGELPYSDYGFIFLCSDIDGDENEDIIIGADFIRQQVGRVYIYWGSELSNPSPQPGRILTGENPGEWFSGMMACGDINNDGYDDLVIGANGYKAGSAQGRAYLYYGGPRH